MVVPFSVEFQTNDNGAIGLFGNNVLTLRRGRRQPDALRSTPGTAPVPNNTLNDNNHVMVNVDADTDPTTRNSSSATVALSDGSTVLWAGPVLGGPPRRPVPGGQAAPAGAVAQPDEAPAARRGRPTGRSTAQRTFGPTGSDQAYQRFRDVTAEVQAAGPGTYWGADVAAGTGEDRYGGWSLTVVYRNPACRCATSRCSTASPTSARASPSRSTSRASSPRETGPVETQLGMVAYDGDRGTTGDRASSWARRRTPTRCSARRSRPAPTSSTAPTTSTAPSMTTPDAGRPSTCSASTSRTSAAPGAIPNGAHVGQRRVLQRRATATSPGVLTTAINLFSPDFSAEHEDRGEPRRPRPGRARRHARVHADLRQRRPGRRRGRRRHRPHPARERTYVPGSLEVLDGANAGVKTDAADGDQAERRGRRGPAPAGGRRVRERGRRPGARARRRRSGSGSPSTTRPPAPRSPTRPSSTTWRPRSATRSPTSSNADAGRPWRRSPTCRSPSRRAPTRARRRHGHLDADRPERRAERRPRTSS